MALTQEQQEVQRDEGRSKTIVLVEDDASNAEMLELLIQTQTPYEVLRLQDGEEVFERLDEVKASLPVLFLLDYHLPRMTALELYDQLRAVEGLEDIPMLVVTASLVDDSEGEFTRRNVPLLYKPFELDELLGSIERLIG